MQADRFGYFIFILLLLLQPGGAIAQESAGEVAGGRGYFSLSRISGEIYHGTSQGIQGSPFLVDEWSPGQIEFSGGETVPVRSLNYNLYLDELVYDNQEIQVRVVVDQASVRAFKIFTEDQDAPLLFRKLEIPRSGAGFVQVLVQGDLQLVCRRTKILVEDTGYPPALHPDYFSRKNTYYMIRPGETPVRLKPANGQLAGFFPEHKKELGRYFRQQHLNVKQEDDLIAAFRYLNTILDHLP